MNIIPLRTWICRSLFLFMGCLAGAAVPPSYPSHWGSPPAIQTRDYRPLPGDYGFGSSTLARWIQGNLDRDRAGGEILFPDAAWTESTPESVGLDSAKLREAVAFLEANAGRDGVRELAIIRRGRMIWKGADIDRVHGIWSCTKSFTSTVLGLLIADGKCSLETRAADILPELRAHYGTVTLRHFTTMTSGYRAEGDEARGSYTHGPSPTPFKPNTDPLFPPGTAYAYWDSAMNELAHALTRIAGEPLDRLLQRRIGDPIGLKADAWKWGDFGEVAGLRVNGGSGNGNKHVQISARELARLGHLFLNEGRWKGRQLIPAEWIRAATSVQVPASITNGWPRSGIAGPGHYGFNWWRNGLETDPRRLWSEAPVNTFAALGHNNNKLLVIPDWQMVIVRLGLDQGDKVITDEAVNGFLARVGKALSTSSVTAPSSSTRPPDGDGSVVISGELKQWHKITLTLDGPYAHEGDGRGGVPANASGGNAGERSDNRRVNPFTDRAMNVIFTHESGSPRYSVPGYFAADGQAANTSAEAGTKWRAHLSPDKPGQWSYAISFTTGTNAALNAGGVALQPYDGRTGTFAIAPTDKTGRDLRARGRLQYVGKHHLRFAGSGEYFLKAGADAPENLLAYADFDGTRANKRKPARAGEATPDGLKTWQPHVMDWRPGDPTWKDGKGRGLIGVLNYLSSKGGNAFSFLTYNAGGDGDDVWPFVERDDKFHYDCSKLDQWGIVFDHATARGLYLHFKLQENELDDNRLGEKGGGDVVPESLDGGALGPERRLYCRELIARFAHSLALNWNIGEENTQSAEEVRDMARYLHETDPYDHLIVIHTYPGQQDKVYPPLLGGQSALTGASLQNSWSAAHQCTLKWIQDSAKAGKPWVVANDEQNPAEMGVPPDPGFEGHSGEAVQGGKIYTLHDIRKFCLWGTLLAGGAGVEYYFGYKLPQNDLQCQNWRSRDRSWDYARIALDFFRDQKIPFWEMANADALVGNPKNDNSRYCLARRGEIYVVFLPKGGSGELDLGGIRGEFSVKWFNPRAGGALIESSIKRVSGGGPAILGGPPTEPTEDWVIVVRRL